MTTAYVCLPKTYLWEVTLSRASNGEIDFRCPVVFVVSRSVEQASKAALALIVKEWHEDGTWYRVAGVKQVSPIHEIVGAGHDD